MWPCWGRRSCTHSSCWCPYSWLGPRPNEVQAHALLQNTVPGKRSPGSFGPATFSRPPPERSPHVDASAWSRQRLHVCLWRQTVALPAVTASPAVGMRLSCSHEAGQRDMGSVRTTGPWWPCQGGLTSHRVGDCLPPWHGRRRPRRDHVFSRTTRQRELKHLNKNATCTFHSAELFIDKFHQQS